MRLCGSRHNHAERPAQRQRAAATAGEAAGLPWGIPPVAAITIPHRNSTTMPHGRKCRGAAGPAPPGPLRDASNQQSRTALAPPAAPQKPATAAATAAAAPAAASLHLPGLEDDSLPLEPCGFLPVAEEQAYAVFGDALGCLRCAVGRPPAAARRDEHPLGIRGLWAWAAHQAGTVGQSTVAAGPACRPAASSQPTHCCLLTSMRFTTSMPSRICPNTTWRPFSLQQQQGWHQVCLGQPGARGMQGAQLGVGAHPAAFKSTGACAWAT